ncbi:MAG: RnfABCDGE type electron transport complex subunit D, partial [Phycisphaerae bacterium]|nr:RnfABCDGE type electron transport complex subunit D [Phycisphaerae bacterium]
GPSAVEQAIYLALPPLADTVVGCTGGGLGETSVVAILLGGIFLIYRGYVRWQLPVSFLFAAAVSAALLPMPLGPSGELVWFPALSGMSQAGAANGLGDWWRLLAVGLSYVSFHLCSGGLMLAAFFLANDMATRPIRLSGQIIFGLGAGVLTIVARIYGGWAMAPLGAYSALLVMNTLTPLIDWLTRPKPRASQSVV